MASGLSSIPAARAWSLSKIQAAPPEMAEVPPKLVAFSTISTLRPLQAAVVAAAKPAAPLPRTTRS
ncbi:hypothetical protein D3C84_1308960 [compost metagenome]